MEGLVSKCLLLSLAYQVVSCAWNWNSLVSEIRYIGMNRTSFAENSARQVDKRPYLL